MLRAISRSQRSPLASSLLVVVEFLAGLGRELEIRPLDDRVDRAGFLAEAAIDALHHVDVVAHRAARAVVAARAGFDGDRLGRADRLAQLAGDAALLAVRIAAQRMLAAEARADRPLLERIVQRRLRREELPHRQEERADEFLEKQRFGGLGEALTCQSPVNSGATKQPTTGSSTNWLKPVMLRTRWSRAVRHARPRRRSSEEVRQPPTPDRPVRRCHRRHHASPVSFRKAAMMTTMASDSGRKTFQPRRISWS